MLINMILKVPEATDIDLMPEPLRKAIASLDPIFPRKLMAGTRVVDGEKLLFSVPRKLGIEDKPKEKVLGLIEMLTLPWQILAMKSVCPQYVCTDLVGGEEVRIEEVLVFEPIHDAEILPFLKPGIDNDGNEVARTGLIQLFQYSITGRDNVAWSVQA